MSAPGSLLKTRQGYMISFLLSYDVLDVREMSLDVYLRGAGRSELWVGRPMTTAVEIVSGDDLAQS